MDTLDNLGVAICIAERSLPCKQLINQNSKTVVVELV
jgi:hypothetical protein